MEYLLSFIFGGLICVIAQIVIDYTSLTPARILTAFVVTGVILSFLGIYEPLKSIGHCGVSVPLLGFGDTLYRGVLKAYSEKGFIGIISGGLSATSAGISSSLLFGFLASIIFKPHSK